MKQTAYPNLQRSERSRRSRIRSSLLALALAVAAAACTIGHEGERCNPYLTHDECSPGLACTQPVDCPERYCCATSGPSRNAFCQPGCNGGEASACAAGGDADCPIDGGGDSGAE
jgi:hypothetical protein